MKVVQINSVCGIGSTGRIATDIHNELLKKGIESYIAYGRDNEVNCNNSIKIGSKIDNYFHVLMTRLFDKHGFFSKKATIEFLKKLEEINPDIIHLHNIHGYYLNIELLFEYLKRKDKKVIWTLHDCWGFTGHCAYFDFVKCQKWQEECFNCCQKKTYPSSIFKDNSKKNYLKKKEIFLGVKNLTIITPSYWLASNVKKSFLKEYEVKVINNGIDLSVFKAVGSNFKKKNKIEDKTIILGVAFPWSPRKGFNDFIELSKVISKNEVIIMVGLSKAQIEKLPKNVIGIEKTNSPQELAEIYSAADIFFNPTYEDNYPTVNLEALACGTYLVTYNTGGSPEVINNNLNGTVIQKKDFNSLLNIIENLKFLKNQNKNDCYRFSKEKFTLDVIETYFI